MSFGAGQVGKTLFLPDDNQLILKVGHTLVWHVIESKLFSFRQITIPNFPFKLTINKVVSLDTKGDNSTKDTVNLVMLALLNSKTRTDVSFEKKTHFPKTFHFICLQYDRLTM